MRLFAAAWYSNKIRTIGVVSFRPSPRDGDARTDQFARQSGLIGVIIDDRLSGAIGDLKGFVFVQHPRDGSGQYTAAIRNVYQSIQIGLDQARLPAASITLTLSHGLF